MDNKMKLNKDKCKVLCLGKKKQMHKYRMGENWLDWTISSTEQALALCR